MIEGLTLQIAVLLSRQFGCDKSCEEGGLAPWRLRAIEERLENVTRAPTLSELAGICKLSVRQLSRGFRASRGLSIGSYVAEKRFEHAKRRLAMGESVKSVAYALGFASPSSFCYAFRRLTGFAPAEFRRHTL